MAADITTIKHPDFKSDVEYLKRYRLAYKGGRAFIAEFLKQYTIREDTTDYNIRAAITYCPAHAKAAILEIKNALFQRMAEVVRTGGTPSYEAVMKGDDGGVDKHGASMNNYIGNNVLDKLLVERKIGVYVDNEVIPQNATLRDTKSKHPYLYTFLVDQICSWNVNDSGELITLLLLEYVNNINEFGLIS